MRIAAFVGKISELRAMLAKHRDFSDKENAPTAATVNGAIG